ncbi:MAG: TlpA disulfide reductase family protein, partial [bacterium]
QLQKFYNKYRDKLKFEMLGISNAEKEEHEDAISGFARDNFITFPLIVTKNDVLQKAYQVHSVPSIFIISKGGVVEEFLSGEMAETEEILLSVFKTYDNLKTNKK